MVQSFSGGGALLHISYNLIWQRGDIYICSLQSDHLLTYLIDMMTWKSVVILGLGLMGTRAQVGYNETDDSESPPVLPT